MERLKRPGRSVDGISCCWFCFDEAVAGNASGFAGAAGTLDGPESDILLRFKWFRADVQRDGKHWKVDGKVFGPFGQKSRELLCRDCRIAPIDEFLKKAVVERRAANLAARGQTRRERAQPKTPPRRQWAALVQLTPDASAVPPASPQQPPPLPLPLPATLAEHAGTAEALEAQLDGLIADEDFMAHLVASEQLLERSRHNHGATTPQLARTLMADLMAADASAATPAPLATLPIDGAPPPAAPAADVEPTDAAPTDAAPLAATSPDAAPPATAPPTTVPLATAPPDATTPDAEAASELAPLEWPLECLVAAAAPHSPQDELTLSRVRTWNSSSPASGSWCFDCIECAAIVPPCVQRQLVDLERDNMGANFPRNGPAFERYFERWDRAVHTVEVDGVMIGFAIVGDGPCNSIFIYELHVAAGYRSRGIGTRLLDMVQDVAGGKSAMQLEVHRSNVRARVFYGHRGFAELDPPSPEAREPELPAMVVMRREPCVVPCGWA